MSKRLSSNDRDILSFRPKIDFVEPDIEDPVIDPINNDVPQIEDVEKNIKRLRDFAAAVDLLAAAAQARADDRAKNMVIELDSNIDAAQIQALQRRFPGSSNQITYAQYRECKDLLREYSLQLGNKMLTTPDKVNAARDSASAALSGNTSLLSASAGIDGNTSLLSGSAGVDGANGNKSITPTLNNSKGLRLGGLNSPGSRRGLLRPELDEDTRIIQPVNIQEFQINMICILVNYIWKNFILPVFKLAKIPIAGVSIASLLPKKLCNEGNISNIPGPVLGQ